MLDHRNTPTESMASSPTQRMFSRRTRTLLKPASKSKQAFYYNRTAKDLPNLREGTVVRIKPLQNPKKPWRKATVKRKFSERSYEVSTEEGATYRRNRRRLVQTQEPPNIPASLQEPISNDAIQTEQPSEQPPEETVETQTSTYQDKAQARTDNDA